MYPSMCEPVAPSGPSPGFTKLRWPRPVLAGDTVKAQALFDRVAAVANNLGLLAEEYDTQAKRQTGNFPQALTHIALINTAHNLSAAKRSTEKPAMQRSK